MRVSSQTEARQGLFAALLSVPVAAASFGFVLLFAEFII